MLEEIDLSTFYTECKVMNSFQMFCSPCSVGLITQSATLPSNTEYYDAEDIIDNVFEVSGFISLA